MKSENKIRDAMTLNQVGEIINMRLREKQWTQHKLAKESGVVQPTISNAVNGIKIGWEAMDKILLALDLELAITTPRK